MTEDKQHAVSMEIHALCQAAYDLNERLSDPEAVRQLAKDRRLIIDAQRKINAVLVAILNAEKEAA